MLAAKHFRKLEVEEGPTDYSLAKHRKTDSMIRVYEDAILIQ